MTEQALCFDLLGVTVIGDGLLAGARLDQSIEQLPARHRIGVRAYSTFSHASHASNGRLWLIPLGIGSAVFSVGLALWARTFDLPARRALPVYVAGVLGAAHMLSTVKAAMINVTQWRAGIDDIALATVLRRFERWQAVRAALQFLTFAAAVWAIAVNGTS